MCFLCLAGGEPHLSLSFPETKRSQADPDVFCSEVFQCLESELMPSQEMLKARQEGERERGREQSMQSQRRAWDWEGGRD